LDAKLENPSPAAADNPIDNSSNSNNDNPTIAAAQKVITAQQN
jgi:hypothetical protein